MSLQFVIVASGPQISASWSTVRQVTGFSGLSDDGQRVVGDLDLLVLDAALLAGFVSSGSIGREASEIVGLAGAELLEAAAGAGLADA